MSRLRTRVLGAAIVTLLVLGTAEGVAMTVDLPDASLPTGDGDAAAVLLRGDPWLLWELNPGDHDEVGVPVHVNALGLRDRDRGPTVGPHPRVLALGDSSVYGFGVHDDEVFTTRLEERFGLPFINGGVPGYSSFQALNLLDMRGWALEPDVLVVGTLWSDNNFDSFTDADLLASYAGWEATPAHAARLVLERSALFRWLDWRLRVAPQGARARKVGWVVGGDDPRTGRRRVDIASYASNLEAFCARMAARGGGVVFLMLANREDIEPVAGDPMWNPFRRVMKDVAARWGAPVVEIPRVFRGSGRSADALFIDQMHPTAIGHAAMAEAVAGALTTRGWPATRLTLTPPTTPLPTYSDPYEGKGREQPAGNVPSGR